MICLMNAKYVVVLVWWYTYSSIRRLLYAACLDRVSRMLLHGSREMGFARRRRKPNELTNFLLALLLRGRLGVLLGQLGT